jgi:hypothetical protein
MAGAIIGAATTVTVTIAAAGAVAEGEAGSPWWFQRSGVHDERLLIDGIWGAYVPSVQEAFDDAPGFPACTIISHYRRRDQIGALWNA